MIEILRSLLDSKDPAVEEAATWALSRFPPPKIRGETSPDETPPALLKKSPPVYPTAAFNQKIEGVVRLGILISAKGEVAHVEIERSVPGLDAAAVDCVRKWVFRPATRAGRPVPLVATAPVSFRIY